MLEQALAFLPRLLPGLWLTAQITLLSMAFGAVMSFTSGLSMLSRRRALRVVARTYTELLRGTSVLVQMFWFFFALPLFGFVSLSPMRAAVLALGLNIGAYGGEVVRGSIGAVPRGQTEASIALNMTRVQTLWRVVIPQAVVGMLPPFGNLVIELMKASAAAFLIQVPELTGRARIVMNTNPNEATLIWTMVLVLYFFVAQGTAFGMRRLERRASRGTGLGSEAVRR